MQVVILAGGLGTRLRAVDPTWPKVLAPVAGRPFVEHQFDLLRAHGLRDVLLCIGHQGQLVVDHVGDGARFGMRVAYAQEDPSKLMGTGGALVNALPKLADEFLVMYGDSYLPTDYRRVVTWFREKKLRGLMTVYRNEGKWDPSNVRVEGSLVVYYSKFAKPGEADCIDYGLSAFRRSVIEAYQAFPMPLDLGKIQSEMVARREMGAYVVSERFYEIGKPEGLAELDDYLRNHRTHGTRRNSDNSV